MTDSVNEPTIRYARTGDGLNIAFYTLGGGPALVLMPGFPVSHLRLEWQNAACRAYLERLARGRHVVRYDCRGAGLSERITQDLSVEAHVRDLEAVADKVGIERFALMGMTHLGPSAITFAARHPARVTHLILWCTYARGSDYSRAPQVEAMRSLGQRDWELYTNLEGHRAGMAAGDDVALEYTRYWREAITAEGAKAAFEAIRAFDVEELLPQVTVPTLVLHGKGSRVLGPDVSRELVSGIPDARLLILEGASLMPFLGDVDAVVSAIEGFLAEGQGDRSRLDGLTPREVQVLRLIATGLSNREIAAELLLSERTVARHVTNIYTKIGVHSKAEATAYAFRHDLS